MTDVFEARAVRVLLLVLLVLVPGACASAGGGGGGGNSDVLTAEQLGEMSANTLMDAIRRVRPAWLRARGGARGSGEPIEVYVDGVRMPEGLDALQRIQAQDVLEVRRLSASDATTQFGTGHGSGAIVVRTR